ncbi:hypothetical protein [uncultured Roseobacter sp.]|uniref:hypothetical protein n=1 Tax=uncultured Roseobacter sp. TaxID=114847 RepID=UPI00262D2E94|nr:hypothetical protein [uncultured Roseobacter sp.]
MIACPNPTEEESARDNHQLRGQFLARQDRWMELADDIRTAETERRATPGGMPLADLLSFGARADVVLAVEHALFDGRPAQSAPLLSGIEALESMLKEADNDMILCTIVAQAHMDIAWAWRGTGWDSQLPQRNRDAFRAHFDRARDILMPFDVREIESPALATAKSALHGAGRSTTDDLVRDCERLIDLDPRNPGSMRALGNYLSPRWFGTHARLELEARRTAARTQSTWGAGGYTWVMFDALSGDDTACAELDLEFFIEGLHDILDRKPHQYTVNLLAAYCANTIGSNFTGSDPADQTRAQIAACADWIVREHMTELHPLTWAHAAAGFNNNLRVHSPRGFAAAGRAEALRIIADLFRREIAQGNRVVFTANGPVTEPA